MVRYGTARLGHSHLHHQPPLSAGRLIRCHLRRGGVAPLHSSNCRSIHRKDGQFISLPLLHQLSSHYSSPTRFGSSGSTDQERRIMVGENEVQVTVTSTAQTVERFLGDVRGEEPLIVGLDEDYYQRGGRGGKTGKMALLQICVGTRCLLLQVGVAGTIPDDLKRFLADEGHVFVGVGIGNDMDRLRREHRIELSKKVELQAMVPFVIRGKWRKVASLKTFGRDLLDVDMEMEYKGTDVPFKNWHLPSLTEDQIKYASTDVFMSYKIGDMLQSEHGFDLHLSQSPVHDGGGHLRFVEDERKKIRTCLACPDMARKNWKWNDALPHAVLQASSKDKIRRTHKELLRYHGFQVEQESDDSGSDDGES